MVINNYPFREIKLSPFYGTIDTTAIAWVLDPSFRGIAPFVFTLEASETPDFSQLVFSKNAGDSYFALDDTGVKQNFFGSFYYRVKLKTGSGKEYISQSISSFAKKEELHKYLKARDIVRKELLRFRYTGHKGWILKRKNYGEISRGTIDPVSGVPISDSLYDQSTGLVGGYHKPLKIMYSEEQVDEDTKLNSQGFGVTQDQTLQIRMIGWPLVIPHDVLVTVEGSRQLVENVKNIYFPGTRIDTLQLLTTKLLPNTDISYKVNIPNE